MKKFILVKIFVISINNIFRRYSPKRCSEKCYHLVSMVQVLQKDLGLFVSIRLSKVPLTVLKQVLEFTMLVKEKVSMKSYS